MLPEHGDSEHACDPSSQEVEIGGSWLWGKPKLHSENISQKPKG
jgi:hypothetical protein